MVVASYQKGNQANPSFLPSYLNIFFSLEAGLPDLEPWRWPGGLNRGVYRDVSVWAGS